jgi:hypothetical protein
MATMPCRSIGMSDQCLWGLAAQFVPTVYSGSVFGSCGLVYQQLTGSKGTFLTSKQCLVWPLARCSEFLRYVGLANSACMFTSLPRPSCTADSRAALRATAPVRSLVHARPCSATVTATAFPSHSPPCHFLCTSHIPSLAFLPHLPLPPQIPLCIPDCVAPILAYLLPCHGVRVPSTCPFAIWRYRCNRLVLYFPKSLKALQSDILYFLLHVTHAPSEHSSRACTDNRINSVPKLYSLDLGTFRAALLFCYPQGCSSFFL